jgi:sodium-coupled neutral amino acid transporter 11
LANNVAGAGILTLSSAKASGTGWIPSIIISISLALCSAHTFILIAKACEMTGEDSFKGLWTKAFGAKTAYIVDSMVFLQCFCVSIIYTGLLGDIFSTLLKSTNFNIPSILMARTGVILSIVIAILWPLNMIRDLSALGFTSILGLCAVLYTVFFIVVRSLDGTYSLGEGGNAVGKFVADGVITKPDFTKSSLWNLDFNALVLMANLGLAYISHYNGPSYWQALDKASSARFTKVAVCAYVILAILYTATMCAGYATFGDACKGTILLNYHPSDIMSTLGKVATGISLVFGFPLVSRGAREGFKNAASALGYEKVADPNNHFALVTSLLCCTTYLAISLSDIKLIAGMTGSIMGSSLVYICPVLIYSRIVKKLKGADSPEYRRARLNLLFVPFGLFVAAMGVTMTLKTTVLQK